MVDMFPPHTQGIKNGSKNIIKHTPKREQRLSFQYSKNYNNPNENNSLKVANRKNVVYNEAKLLRFGGIVMDEIVEILTEDGKKIGERINKSIAHKKGICHGISAIALIDNSGKLLIQKRSSNKRTEPNKWDLSGAGHIDIDEAPEYAAVRELFEETGINVKTEELKLIDTYLNKIKLDNDTIINHYTYLFLVQKDVDINNIKIQESEVSSAIFVDKKKYIELFNNKEMVDAIKYCNKVLEYMN